MTKLKVFKEHIQLGCLFMALTGLGIPFIPFVPISVLLGGFSSSGSGIGAGFGNILFGIGLTFVLGILFYSSIVIYFFVK